METRTIYFDYQKSTKKLLLGIGIIISTILAGRTTIWIIPILLIGGSFIYFGSKSLSRKPQLIFSEEGLFIGYNINKGIPWRNIHKITIKNKTVDYQSMDFIEIVTRIKTNAPSNKLVRQYPIDNLHISRFELLELIEKYLSRHKDAHLV